jgi:hypothetical protein
MKKIGSKWPTHCDEMSRILDLFAWKIGISQSKWTAITIVNHRYRRVVWWESWAVLRRRRGDQPAKYTRSLTQRLGSGNACARLALITCSIFTPVSSYFRHPVSPRQGRSSTYVIWPADDKPDTFCIEWFIRTEEDVRQLFPLSRYSSGRAEHHDYQHTWQFSRDIKDNCNQMRWGEVSSNVRVETEHGFCSIWMENVVMRPPSPPAAGRIVLLNSWIESDPPGFRNPIRYSETMIYPFNSLWQCRVICQGDMTDVCRRDFFDMVAKE